MRLALTLADTLVTPLNDSFLDFDVLGTVDAATFGVIAVGHYAQMVRYARRQRRIVDGWRTDWIVVCNRLALLGSRNTKIISECLARVGLNLSFRPTDVSSDRLVVSALFPLGV